MDKIVILDFGGQYAHLIANRIRRLGVYAELRHPTDKYLNAPDIKGIILSGGPASVYDQNQPRYNTKIFRVKVPLLGLCYGHQLICQQLGGEVKPGKVREYGMARLRIGRQDALFKGLYKTESVWMSHGDSVKYLPDGFRIIGSTEHCPVAAMAHPQKKIFGLQFHPEVTHTLRGMLILRNFLKICSCREEWSVKDYQSRIRDEIKRQVKNKKVFMLVSGGVDSTVAFALLTRVLGEKKVFGLHIDNGFMRKDETSRVRQALQKEGIDNLEVVDASPTFLKAVDGVTQPEEKRKIIGKTFIAVWEDALRRLKLNAKFWILGQGTIYPDTIESGGTRHAAVIKTHHNRIALIEKMIEQGRVVEPLATLYKDEVRKLGTILGLPKSLIWRHPFPGPGLAVRVLCSNRVSLDGEDDLEKLSKKVNAIAQKEGLQAKVLPVSSVGVQGDGRTYAHPAVVIGRADWKIFEKVSTLITNQVKEVNRVVTLLWPATVDQAACHPAYLDPLRLELLREVDEAAIRLLNQYQFYDKVWQMPVILMPLSINGQGTESIVLRPVLSQEAMTARFAPLARPLLQNFCRSVRKFSQISAVFFDVTHKPPGTIEWE